MTLNYIRLQASVVAFDIKVFPRHGEILAPTHTNIIMTFDIRLLGGNVTSGSSKNSPDTPQYQKVSFLYQLTRIENNKT